MDAFSDAGQGGRLPEIRRSPGSTLAVGCADRKQANGKYSGADGLRDECAGRAAAVAGLFGHDRALKDSIVARLGVHGSEIV
jgi:hypothetical protein